MKKSDIGIFGLGLMGRNLALNINDNGFQVSVFNSHLPGQENIVEGFLSLEADDTDIQGFEKIDDFVESLAKPRKVLLMIKAGDPVDAVIEELTPLLSPGDILIDGGNSNYEDTIRRSEVLADNGIRYVGMGVSGGEEGARKGPSLMPSGNNKAWPELQPILQPIAATAPDGTPCCKWMGAGGAGHFVKMTHNGIEYAIMQLISECYHLMKSSLGMNNEDIKKTFDSWNTDLLNSYLLDITSDIFSVRENSGVLLLDHILDKAKQKGTGRWAAITAMELGTPAPTITEAVFSRSLSSFKELRKEASEFFDIDRATEAPEEMTNNLRAALLGGQLVAYAEGFWLLKAANNQFDWGIPLEDVARCWQAGCIIQSTMLDPIAAAYRHNDELSHLLLAPAFKKELHDIQDKWRLAAAFGMESSVPIPTISAALNHFDTLRTERLPANLIQAQRDYFGGHQYERTDRPSGQLFHTDWKNRDII